MHSGKAWCISNLLICNQRSVNLYIWKKESAGYDFGPQGGTCVGLITGDYLCWFAVFLWSDGTRDTRSIHQGPLRPTLVTAAEKQPCDCLYRELVSGARRQSWYLHLGLLVLTEQIFLLGGRLQPLTLTVEWITSSADKRPARSYCGTWTIQNCLFFSCSIESFGNCNIKKCAY